MPPIGSLSAEEIRRIENWIDAGAPYPGKLGSDGVWWSFRPVAPIQPPAERDPWIRGEVDAFIFGRLKAAGITPNGRADPAALLRRVYLDLAGRPPSLDELSAFLADPSDRAYKGAVKRLLASPEYGERWASYWLDLARYAEDTGLPDELYPEAWRFRDYVIRSLNEDKPYPQFLKEQIAGDELAPDDPNARIATGFLAVGALHSPWRAVRARRQQRLNEITGTVGSAVLGLTFDCARCHDHKYDPIKQSEYFQFQAYFAGIDARPGIPLLSDSEWHDYKWRAEDWSQRTAKVREELADFERPYRQKMLTAGNVDSKIVSNLKSLRSSSDPLDQLIFAGVDRLTPENVVHQRILQASRTRDADAPFFSVTWGLLVGLLAAALVSWMARGRVWERIGPIGLLAVGGAAVAGLSYAAAKVMARSSVSLLHAPAEVVEGKGLPPIETVAALGRDLRLDTTLLLRWIDGLLFGETATAACRNTGVFLYGHPEIALVAGLLLAVGAVVLMRQVSRLTQPNPASKPNARRLTSLRAGALFCAFSVLALVTTGVSAAPRRQTARWRMLQLRLQAYGSPVAAGTPTALGVVELGAAAPEVKVLAPDTLEASGEPLQPGVPSALGRSPRIAPLPDSSGRRTALAGWLTTDAYPLVARTLVNRVWQQHFGRGLAESTGDMGLAGERPTHPELLEWLTGEFIQSGGSLKHLHELLVTSATYCQDSRSRPDGIQRDPEGRLLWRFQPRRLDAEALRDTMLFVSGELDPARGGPPVPGEAPRRTAPKRKRARVPSQGSTLRRSVYLAALRTGAYSLLETLDAPVRRQPCPRRAASNTPGQAMLFLNSSFAHERAQAFAARVLRSSSDDGERIVTAYRLAFGRAPASDEVQAMRVFLRRLATLGSSTIESKQEHAPANSSYETLCLALLNANEFAYVD